MTKFLKTLATCAAATVLITGVIAGSARHVRAQDADDWHVTPGPSIAQPAAKPLPDLNGCWQGEIDVRHQGSGTGEIDFYQNGKSVQTYTELDFPDGSQITMAMLGTTGPVSFRLHGPCHASMSGRIVAPYTVAGTFHVNGCGLKGTGTFGFNSEGPGSGC